MIAYLRKELKNLTADYADDTDKNIGIPCSPFFPSVLSESSAVKIWKLDAVDENHVGPGRIPTSRAS